METTGKIYTCLKCGKHLSHEDEGCPECGSMHIGFGQLYECPECMLYVEQSEIDMFGGLCEDCANE